MRRVRRCYSLFSFKKIQTGEYTETRIMSTVAVVSTSFNRDVGLECHVCNGSFYTYIHVGIYDYSHD